MNTNNRKFPSPGGGALLILLLCAPLLSGCAFYGGGVSGYVYEWVDQSKPPREENIKPVPDAYVVAIWGGTVPRPIDATSTCLNVKLGKTDANGHYDIPGWFRFPRFYPVFMDKVATREYKHGYEYKEWLTSGQFNLVPSTQTPDERINFLRRAASFYCEEIGEDLHRELAPLYRAIFDEAQSLKGVSPTERYVIDGLRDRIAEGQTGQKSK